MFPTVTIPMMQLKRKDVHKFLLLIRASTIIKQYMYSYKEKMYTNSITEMCMDNKETQCMYIYKENMLTNFYY